MKGDSIAKPPLKWVVLLPMLALLAFPCRGQEENKPPEDKGKTEGAKAPKQCSLTFQVKVGEKIAEDVKVTVWVNDDPRHLSVDKKTGMAEFPDMPAGAKVQYEAEGPCCNPTKKKTIPQLECPHRDSIAIVMEPLKK